jgi:hypothetical protein
MKNALVLLPVLLCACEGGGPVTATDPSRVRVEIASPEDGDIFAEGEPVTLSAAITDLDGVPAQVDGISWEVFGTDWRVDGNPVAVSDLPVGELDLQVIADVAGKPVKDTISITIASNEPESECDDGLDDDADGLTDCDDDDCAGVVSCGWPTSLSHSATIAYDASWLAELSGYSSCAVSFNGTLDRVRGDGQCGACDRTFEGAVSYTDTSCADNPGDLPSTVRYGIVFTSESAWAICSTDGTSRGESGTATGGGGTYTLSRSDPIVVDSNDAGDLNTTLTYTEL